MARFILQNEELPFKFTHLQFAEQLSNIFVVCWHQGRSRGWSCLFACLFLPRLSHVEIPGPGTEPMLQQQPKPHQWKHWIFNPLSHQGRIVLIINRRNLFTWKARVIINWFNDIWYIYPLFMSLVSVSWFQEFEHQKKNNQSGIPIVAQQKRIWPASMRMQVQSLASLSGLRIQHGHELWWRS